MIHIYDKTGIDIGDGDMLRVPNKAYGSFPSAATHIGGWHYDTGMNIMYWSDGSTWKPVSSTFGTVTNVGMTASGALDVMGSPITNTGTFNLYWTSSNLYLVQGDGSVVLKSSIIPNLIPGTGISITGSYPNLTISNTFGNPVGRFVAMNLVDAGYVSVQNAVNANTIFTASELYIQGGTNAPTPSGFLKTIGVGTNYGWQIFKPYDSDFVYTRSLISSSWGSWSTFGAFNFIDGNGFDGTVSYSGITPTLSLTTTVSNGQIMYSSGGAIAGSPGLTWNGNQVDITGNANPGFRIYNSGTGFYFYNGAYGPGNFSIFDIPAGLDRMTILSSGVIRIQGLSGSGIRMVTADPNGDLGVSAIPTGTVTQVTSGSLSPLFNVSVATNLTTPAISFAAISQTAKHVYAAPWGANGIPFFRQLQTSDLQQNGATLGQVITWDGTAWTAQNPSAGVTPSALTRTNDTNVTLTLGGSPTIALLAATSMTLGWSGVLSEARGGSKWTQTSFYIQPTSSYDIRAFINSSNGWAVLSRGSGSGAGNVAFYSHTQALVGYIGNQSGYMSYDVSIGNHRFSGGSVQLSSIPLAASATDILVSNGGIISYRAMSTLAVPSAVWMIQGGSIFANAINDNMYHQGKVKVGAGTTNAISAYDLTVTGSNGIASNSNLEFTSLSVGVSGVDSGITIRNMIRQVASSRIEIGNTTNELLLAGHTSARSNDTLATTNKYLFVDTSGIMRLERFERVKNDAFHWFLTSAETITVTPTWTRLTFDGSTTVSPTYYGFGTTSGDYTVTINPWTRHTVNMVLQFTTTVLSAVEVELRDSGGGIYRRFNLTTAELKSMIFGTFMIGASGSALTPQIYIRCLSGASISVTNVDVTFNAAGQYGSY